MKKKQDEIKEALKFVHVEKTVTGARHIYQDKQNQDYVKFYENESVVCISVSDGCSGCEYPEQAAKINAKAAEIMAANRVTWSLSEKEFKKTAARIYSERFAESGYPVDELCATTAFVIIHKQTQEYIAFSVGDSAVLVVNEELVPRPLLEPVNGIRKTQTVFTNDNSAVVRLSGYSRGRIKGGISGFVLYTDGADTLAVPPFTEAQQLVSALLISEETAAYYAEEFAQQAAGINMDDITFAAVMPEIPQLKEAAESTYCGKRPEPEETAPADDEPERTKRAEPPFGKRKTARKPAPPVSDETVKLTAPQQDLPEQAEAVQPEPEQPEPEQKTAEPAASEAVPAQDAPAEAETPADLLGYLQQPRTAGELTRANLGLCPENFMDSILTLLRLRLVTVAAQEDGKIVFRRCA